MPQLLQFTLTASDATSGRKEKNDAKFTAYDTSGHRFVKKAALGKEKVAVAHDTHPATPSLRAASATLSPITLDTAGMHGDKTPEECVTPTLLSPQTSEAALPLSYAPNRKKIVKASHSSPSCNQKETEEITPTPWCAPCKWSSSSSSTSGCRSPSFIRARKEGRSLLAELEEAAAEEPNCESSCEDTTTWSTAEGPSQRAKPISGIEKGKEKHEKHQVVCKEEVRDGNDGDAARNKEGIERNTAGNLATCTTFAFRSENAFNGWWPGTPSPPQCKSTPYASLRWNMKAFFREQVSWESRCIEFSRKLLFYTHSRTRNMEKRGKKKEEWSHFQGACLCMQKNIKMIQEEIKVACAELLRKTKGVVNTTQDAFRDQSHNTKVPASGIVNSAQEASKKGTHHGEMMPKEEEEEEEKKRTNVKKVPPLTIAPQGSVPSFDGAEGCWLLTLMECQCDQLLTYACALERDERGLAVTPFPASVPYAAKGAPFLSSFPPPIPSKAIPLLRACHMTAVGLLQHLHPFLSPCFASLSFSFSSSWRNAAEYCVVPSIPPPPLIRVLFLSLRLRALRYLYLTTPCMVTLGYRAPQDGRGAPGTSPYGEPPAVAKQEVDIVFTKEEASSSPTTGHITSDTLHRMKEKLEEEKIHSAPCSSHASPLSSSCASSFSPLPLNRERKKYENEARFLSCGKRLRNEEECGLLTLYHRYRSQGRETREVQKPLGTKEISGETKWHAAGHTKYVRNVDGDLREVPPSPRKQDLQPFPSLPPSLEGDRNRAPSMKTQGDRERDREPIAFLLRTLRLSEGGAPENDRTKPEHPTSSSRAMPGETSPMELHSLVMLQLEHAIHATLVALLHALHLMCWESDREVQGDVDIVWEGSKGEIRQGKAQWEPHEGAEEGRDTERKNSKGLPSITFPRAPPLPLPESRDLSTPLFFSKWWNPVLYSILLSVCELLQWGELSRQGCWPLCSQRGYSERETTVEEENTNDRPLPGGMAQNVPGIPHHHEALLHASDQRQNESEKCPVHWIPPTSLTPRPPSCLPFYYVRTALHVMALCLRQPCCGCAVGSPWNHFETPTPSLDKGRPQRAEANEENTYPMRVPPFLFSHEGTAKRGMPAAVTSVLQTLRSHTGRHLHEKKEAPLLHRMITALTKSCEERGTALSCRYGFDEQAHQTGVAFYRETSSPYDTTRSSCGRELWPPYALPYQQGYRYGWQHPSWWYPPPPLLPPTSVVRRTGVCGTVPRPREEAADKWCSSSPTCQVFDLPTPILHLAPETEERIRKQLMEDFRMSSPFSAHSGLSSESLRKLPALTSRPGYLFSGIFSDESLDWNFGKGMDAFNCLSKYLPN